MMFTYHRYIVSRKRTNLKLQGYNYTFKDTCILRWTQLLFLLNSLDFIMRAGLASVILVDDEHILFLADLYEFVWSCALDCFNGFTILYMFYKQCQINQRLTKHGRGHDSKRPNYNTKSLIDILNQKSANSTSINRNN